MLHLKILITVILTIIWIIIGQKITNLIVTIIGIIAINVISVKYVMGQEQLPIILLVLQYFVIVGIGGTIWNTIYTVKINKS